MICIKGYFGPLVDDNFSLEDRRKIVRFLNRLNGLYMNVEGDFEYNDVFLSPDSFEDYLISQNLISPIFHVLPPKFQEIGDYLNNNRDEIVLGIEDIISSIIKLKSGGRNLINDPKKFIFAMSKYPYTQKGELIYNRDGNARIILEPYKKRKLTFELFRDIGFV
jgi:hypothetical protein